MAFWGGGGATSQVITVPDWRFYCGRECVTTAFWVYLSANNATVVSFLRQDLTMISFQNTSSVARTNSWHGTGGTGTIQASDYAGISGFPTGEWVLNVHSYRRAGNSTFYYRPSTGAVTNFANVAWSNPIVTKTTANLKPFVIGGHETSGELMRTGDGIAEISVYPFAVYAQHLISMARNPEIWRQKAAFYLSLRAPSGISDACGGPRRRIQLGSTSAARFAVDDHPPVPYMGQL